MWKAKGSEHTYIGYQISEQRALFLSSFRPWIATQIVIGCLLRASDRVHTEKEIKDKMSGFTDYEKSLHSLPALQHWQDETLQTRTPRAFLKADTGPGCPQELPAYTAEQSRAERAAAWGACQEGLEVHLACT